ncbi:MAG: bifunctional folylpolyglutamate synthase/dihydrofolate synthase [Saprospiraceae bacterium]|nr:bifunctional folylpolyglutamate synthase/dihydrofolate synthase [Saprospiraceae bacterium]
MNNYEEVLHFLYRQLPMYQRQGPTAYKKDLGNIRSLCHYLGHPQNKLPCIHVAGTNGKGSVSHIMAACLQSAGHRVGLYSSPHYKDFRERIKINGSYIPKDYVVDFVQRIAPSIKVLHPSFFEITVAMALDFFTRQEVDIAVIETGLGGRLDSTNIIHPKLCIITNISLDHQDMLGSTLQLIAIEKAGIIKWGTPVVIGERGQETDREFEKVAARRMAPIFFAQDLIQLKRESATHRSQSLKIVLNKTGIAIHKIELGLGGRYQIHNCTTVLAAIFALRQLGILQVTEDQIRQGCMNVSKATKMLGRWQVLGESPVIISDSAHNEAGFTQVIKELAEIPCQKLHMVLGFVTGKDLESILALLPLQAYYYFCEPQVPRRMNVAEVLHLTRRLQLQSKPYHSVEQALRAARDAASKDDVIYIGGSSFVVAEVI